MDFTIYLIFNDMSRVDGDSRVPSSQLREDDYNQFEDFNLFS